MNIWLQHVNEVILVAPIRESDTIDPIESCYLHSNIKVLPLRFFQEYYQPDYSFFSRKYFWFTLKTTCLFLPNLFRGMFNAEHIHLRCPGYIGLLGCLIQILFPFKVKSAKYAGNWDWASNQPASYRLQQRILRNTFLSKKIQVLVYGEWKDKTKNIVPAFTATYSEVLKTDFVKPNLHECINLLFVGTLSTGKRPELCLEVLSQIKSKGYKVKLTFCGNGPLYKLIEEESFKMGLNNDVVILGNLNANDLVNQYINSHFLILPSKSEGWPKVLAEAMWWGVIPVATSISCVPQMLGDGTRGVIVQPDPEEITNRIIEVIQSDLFYSKLSKSGLVWSRNYTIEKFEEQIIRLIKI
jgi:glycosyltransferase involved in cell wall biosynthesis